MSAIEIPASTKTIGEFAFLGCSRLASLTLNEGLEKICSGAFYKCPITSLVIPDSVTAIETPYGNYFEQNYYHGAFEGCTKLTSVVIGSGLANIERETFRGCTSLKSVVIGDYTESVGESAFQGCTALTDITMGSGLQTIGAYAFSGCTALVTTELGSGVSSIGQYAFYNCTALSAIEIPASTKTIGEFAFLGCSRLASLTLNEGLEKICSGAFYKCPITSLVIPDSVTAIETPYGNYFEQNYYHGAFEGCTKLTSVVIGSGLANIERETFRGCSAMKSVTVGKGVRSVGDYAFYGCSSLTDIRFLGTMEECNAIVIGQDFAASVPADTIVCSDGNLAWG